MAQWQDLKVGRTFWEQFIKGSTVKGTLRVIKPMVVSHTVIAIDEKNRKVKAWSSKLAG